jgi:type II secretory pathway pseudopilin PulG
MVSPRPAGGAAEAGFTLAEILAALTILLIGIVSLLATLGSSVALRRSTDARLQAAQLCEQAVHTLRATAIRRKADAQSDLDLELAPLENQEAPGFPGMTWSASVVTDPDRAWLWLATIRVQWLEEGQLVQEEFLRVLPAELPLRERVQRFRDTTPNATR